MGYHIVVLSVKRGVYLLLFIFLYNFLKLNFYKRLNNENNFYKNNKMSIVIFRKKIIGLVFFTAMVGVIIVFSASIRIRDNISEIEKLVANGDLYICNIKNNPGNFLYDNLRLSIISKLNRLVVLNHLYRKNDSLKSVAMLYGTDVDSIRSSNYIEAVGLLYEGKPLVVSNKKGLLYKVRKGENIETIAKRFKRNVEELMIANDKPANYKFDVGEYVYIPGAYIKFKDFMLPVFNTKVTSRFGQRIHPLFGILKFHEGIDLKQKYGAPVRAACDGKVIYAGWAEGYGNLVILKHQKGYTTYYGHLSKIRVRCGKYVVKGEIIGNVGTTGWVTGPHLHFEVRKNGVPIDPKKVF